MKEKATNIKKIKKTKKKEFEHESIDEDNEIGENLNQEIENENENIDTDNNLEFDGDNVLKSKKKDKNTKEFKTDIMSSHIEVMNLIDEFKQTHYKKKEYKCLPWVEEYRPKKLKNVIDHEEHVSTLQKLNKKNQFPHLLLSGPPGTGKTSTIIACAKELYKDKFPLMVLNINASEERGIDVVRYKIKDFIMTKGIYDSSEKYPSFKLVVLDEADAMTEDAQSMLVYIMEKYTHNARFCLMCNYIKKIKPAIQSRCTIFRFAPLKREFIVEKIKDIANKNKCEITEDGIDTLIKIANGDMRKVINNLQATHMAFETEDGSSHINSENICSCIGHPYQNDIDKIHNLLIKKNIKECYDEIEKIIRENGYSLKNIVNELFDINMKEYMSGKGKNINIEELIINLRTIESNLTMCQNENIQLAGVVASFKLAILN